MDCRLARDLLTDYQDGALDAVAAAALAAHLRGCGECAGCAGSLLAVREALRGLPPDPAPPELLPRILAAVEGEDRDVRADPHPVGADATRPFLSRFRLPLEAAAAILLFATVYWYQYQRTPATAVLPPSGLSSGISSEAGKATSSRPTAAKEDAVKGAPSGVGLPGVKPKAAREKAPAAAKPRTWTAADLPSVPAILASTNSERIVPVAPPHWPAADPAAAEAPGLGERRSPDAEGGADSRPWPLFAAPPFRLLRPLPYGREIVVDVTAEGREGAEERIAVAALRSGGIVERIERQGESARIVTTGAVRVILPEAAATGFLDELRRIGTVPAGDPPSANDLPAGPRPGTVAYAVRIRVR